MLPMAQVPNEIGSAVTTLEDVSATVCGPDAALSFTVRVPLYVVGGGPPPESWVACTEMVQTD